MMKFAIAAAAAALFAAGPTQAQNVLMMNGNGNAPIFRPPAGSRGQTISINFQMSLPAASPIAGADATRTIAEASQSLYDIVNHECEILSVSLKGDCRIVSINIGGNLNTRTNPGAPAVSANANVTFEIAPPAPAPAPHPSGG